VFAAKKPDASKCTIYLLSVLSEIADSADKQIIEETVMKNNL